MKPQLTIDADLYVTLLASKSLLERIQSEHAALVAVATAADNVIKANNVLLEAQRQGDNNAMADAMIALYAELDVLAAVRAGSEVSK
jgi:hypothetical protein